MTDPTQAEPVALGSLRSRNPLPASRAEHRTDPYWDGMWDYASTAQWMSMKTKRRMVGRGLGRLRSIESRWGAEQACGLLATHKPEARRARLGALAAVGMWRTVLPDQLAAIVGAPALANDRSTDRSLLVGSELVQEGRLPTGMIGGGHHTLLRPDYNGDFEQLATRMSYTDWVGVTAGRPWTWGSQFDRHNLLGTELALRIAEYCDVPVVLGESLAQFSVLAPHECGLQRSQRAADAVVVRGDGMRIAVEVTATLTRSLLDKIEFWAKLLERDTDQLMSVVFVDAAHPDRSDRQDVAGALRMAIGKSANATWARSLARVPQRMLVARWVDWFPEAGAASRLFPLLPALAPTGDGGDLWQEVEMLSPFDLPAPRSPERAAALIANAAALYGMPHWLRVPGAAPDFESIARSRGGVELPAPVGG